MGYQEDLVRLEGIVEKLLHRLEGLKKEKLDLEAALRGKEEELMEMQRQNASLSEERSEVHQRVSRLIGVIEEWEESQAAETAGIPEQQAQLELNLNNS